MIYLGNFTNKDGVQCTVRFTIPGSSETKKLVLADSPVVIKYASDDLFKPMKCSGATVRIWTNEFLPEFFNGAPFNTRCEIFEADKKVWAGYVTPNLYNQDFCKKSVLEIECRDYISVLSDIEYHTINKDVETLWNVIVKCLQTLKTTFGSIYVHNFVTEQLYDFWISEQNFYDESGEAMKAKEVIEHILRYLNLTMFQSGDDIYIIDYNLLKNNSLSFNKYPFLLTTWDEETLFYPQADFLAKSSKVQIKPQQFQLSRLKMETGATISLGEIYNKIAVRSSIYNLSSYTPNLDDDSKIIEAADMFERKKDKYFMKGRLFTHPDFVLSGDAFNPDAGDWGGKPAILIKGKAHSDEEETKDVSKWEYMMSKRIGLNMNDVQIDFFTINSTTAGYGNGLFVLNMDCLINNKDMPIPQMEDQSQESMSTMYQEVLVKIGNYSWNSRTGTWEYGTVYNDIVFTPGGYNKWMSVKNTNTNMLDYPGITGFAMPVTNVISGPLKIVFRARRQSYTHCWTHVKNIKLEFHRKKIVNTCETQFTNEELKDTDTLYENVIDLNYVKECDEIKLKVASDTAKGLSLSSVMSYEEYFDDFWQQTFFRFGYTKEVIKKNNNESGLFEHHLIDALYNQNKEPRKLLEFTCMDKLSIISLIHDDTDKYIVNGLSINMADCTYSANLIEKA